MFDIRYVTEVDKAFGFTLGRHMDEGLLLLNIRDRRCYVISDDNAPVGIMRYNLFWHSTPFLTLIHLGESHRGKALVRGPCCSGRTRCGSCATSW